MDGVNEELANRIWENAAFQKHFATVTTAWLQSEMGMEKTAEFQDADLSRALQAAAILSQSADPVRQRAAYGIAACANDLRGTDLPGLSGLLRIVLTGMGNFPAIGTSETVDGFHRLPMPMAISEEARRTSNTVVLGDVSLVLTDFQRELWDLLLAGSRVAISAPTSAGKSFVLQAYLRELARSKQLTSACYIVPSRALIAQVTDAVTAWRQEAGHTDLAIINVPLTGEVTLPEKAIYVLTQERLQAIIATHPLFAPELIISDEAQSIDDGSRGVLLQNVVDTLLERNPAAQLIFAGPNIRNLSIFAEIFGLKTVAEVSSRSPSVIQNLIVVNTRSPIKGRLSIQRFTPGTRGELGFVDIGRNTPSIRERLIRVSERFGQAKPSIVYANGPAEAEKIALGLTQVFDEVPSTRLADLAAFIRAAVHPDYDLARCLTHGVGFHYGRIPALVRRGVETAFSEGHIRYLVTTSTLIQGVNFPAANLFVCNPKKGNTKALETSEFWNLAGRAGRLGKEFQGNIFLIDYDEWPTLLANQGNDLEVRSFLKATLTDHLEEIEVCAREANPGRETEHLVDVEAAFARLLADHMKGTLETTLTRCGVDEVGQNLLRGALDVARSRVSLPGDIIGAAPTVSAIRQQRLAAYLTAEIEGGGISRLEELIPRHPRDPDAWKVLSEIYRICHEQVLSWETPKLHLRMAAISLRWMRGDPLPEIINENVKYNKDKPISSVIRETLQDIEQQIRFTYFRLTACYISVLSHVLTQKGHVEYLGSLAALPTYLEVGASDQTMISFIALGLSRMAARMLTDEAVDKEMGPVEALRWLRRQNVEAMIGSPIVRADIERALLNSTAG
ncbi:MAG: DEAD/DEAH box helicase [Pseudomonadota bacterium]